VAASRSARASAADWASARGPASSSDATRSRSDAMWVMRASGVWGGGGGGGGGREGWVGGRFSAEGVGAGG